MPFSANGNVLKKHGGKLCKSTLIYVNTTSDTQSKILMTMIILTLDYGLYATYTKRAEFIANRIILGIFSLWKFVLFVEKILFVCFLDWETWDIICERVFWVNSTAKCLKKYHKNERHLCLVAYIFTKLSQNVCLINTNILMYWHFRCNH